MTQVKRHFHWMSMFSLVATVLLMAASGVALADDFVDQPANKHSNITGTPTAAAKDAESLADNNFASALHNALGDNGFHSMVITFGQCFAGGMMDDVADTFAGSTQPISMTSGAKHDEPSGSARSSGGAKNDGFARWAESYQKVNPGKAGATNNNPKQSDAYTNAQTQGEWTGANPKRSSQHKTLNSGGDIKLGDGTGGSGATSYHAILFAGNTKGRSDYWNDIVRQQRMLTKSGYPGGNVKVLYGDGNAPNDAAEGAGAVGIDASATRQNLLDEIAALNGVMNANEQLYIYIGDHGSPDQGGDTKQIPPKATKDASNTFALPFLELYELKALNSSDNTSGPYVEMNILGVPGPITSSWEVYFNNVAVDSSAGTGDNTLPGSSSSAEVRFLVDETLVSPGGNDVWLRNPNVADSDIEVELFFSMGDLQTEASFKTTFLMPTLFSWGAIAFVLLLIAAMSVLERRRTMRRSVVAGPPEG